MLQSFKLKNGLSVASYSIPQMRSVYIDAAVKAGSIFDTPKTSGTAHFMEHILVEGTPSFPTIDVFSNYIEKLAGSYNASTASQSIRFYMNLPARHLEDAVKITSEVLFEPLFAEDSIEKERGAIMQEIHEREDNLWYKLNSFFTKTRYQLGHPLLLDGGGSIDAIKSLKKQDLVAYWQRFFDPQNTYIILVGGFENGKAKEVINKYFSKYLAQKKFEGFPAFTNDHFTNRTIAIRNDPKLKTCYVDLTFPSIPGHFSLKDHLPQTIIGNILGRLRVSRLYRLLRHQRGLVYDVRFTSSAHQGFGLAGISCQTEEDKLWEVIELITKELVVFAKNGPTDEEIRFAKNYSENRSLMQFDHPSSIADWIGPDLMWEDTIYLPEEYVKMIEVVDKGKIMEFIEKYWDFKRVNLTVQGPLSDSKSNHKKLDGLIADIC